MAKVTDLWILVTKDDQKIDFQTPVNVTKDGIFTTTLPKEAVEKISEYGLELNRNRLGNPGYFEAKTLSELKINIKTKCLEALSRELVEDKMVIKYQINTECAYCKDADGEIVPNGLWLKKETEDNMTDRWVNGTGNGQFASYQAHTPSISVWACVFHKKKYRYQSGKEVTLLEKYEPKCSRSESAIDWINSLCRCEPTHISRDKFGVNEKGRQLIYNRLPEVDATEKNAQFFKVMFQMLFKMNEMFSSFVNPDFLTEYLRMHDIKEISL